MTHAAHTDAPPASGPKMLRMSKADSKAMCRMWRAFATLGDACTPRAYAVEKAMRALVSRVLRHARVAVPADPAVTVPRIHVASKTVFCHVLMDAVSAGAEGEGEGAHALRRCGTFCTITMQPATGRVRVSLASRPAVVLRCTASVRTECVTAMMRMSE